MLVVSDRVDFLKNCAKLTGDNAVCVTGAIHHENRAEIINQIYEDKDVLYGTQAIFSEGISLNRNESERFESRYSFVRVVENNSIMLKNMVGLDFGIWGAHGEGKIVRDIKIIFIQRK